jgi:hypothetical protein
MDANFQNHVAQSLGRIEQKVTSLDDRLFGDSGEMKTLHSRIDSAENKQWIHTFVIIPVVATLNALIRYLSHR